MQYVSIQCVVIPTIEDNAFVCGIAQRSSKPAPKRAQNPPRRISSNSLYWSCRCCAVCSRSRRHPLIRLSRFGVKHLTKTVWQSEPHINFPRRDKSRAHSIDARLRSLRSHLRSLSQASPTIKHAIAVHTPSSVKIDSFDQTFGTGFSSCVSAGDTGNGNGFVRTWLVREKNSRR